MKYSQELRFAKDLAYQAGKIMRKHFSLSIKTEMKKNITPVTIADTKINDLVITKITKNYPDHSIIAEEKSSEKDGAEFTWICDPLDGTIPYTLGMPTSVFSLALYRNKKPILGVLYDPYLDRLYHALTGQGSYLNTSKIKTSKGSLQPGDSFAALFTHTLPVDSQKMTASLFKRRIWLTQIHSVVYLLCYIASGQLKAAVLPPAHVWDRAAAAIVLENAGGMITDENGKKLDVFKRPKLLIASNGECHQEFMDIVKAAFI